LIVTNDGLVGYKRVGGSDGARLVPDLATSLPTPTDGGRTYTFQIHPGIRYSNGALVRPADFRRGLERMLAKHADTAFFYSRIVGADGCAKTPPNCDLSQGIVADPESNTVTFHLTAPDPDLLHKLTLPAAFAVPAGTPISARLPLPATGPYMIASYDPKHGARLVRNPRFHEWSAAAQPSGYPDEIVLRTGLSPDAQVSAVERGKADVLHGLPDPPSRVSVLRRQHASWLQVNPAKGTVYVFLNTRLPPFNNPKARQAVNYAVDRNRTVELQGGTDRMQPTCQVLPPNFDGYSRYCPYTNDPRADGKYTGPDLSKARALVAASGTSGQAVTVWTTPGCCLDRYFVSVLRSLGYRARLKVVPSGNPNSYLSVLSDSRRKVQAGITGWFADYLSPSNFFPQLLTCASYHPRSADNENVAGFCDPRIDDEIARSRSLQTTDPQAASQLWSKVDRDIVDQAPWVAVMNPRWIDFVSPRVGNFQFHPQWIALFDQLWVK
jgi:peptide/nickel transport system substrate-binding protein